MSVSEAMEEVLEGRLSLTQAPAAIQSCLRLPIYQKACQILELPTKEERRAEIDKAPPLIKPYLEAEVLRIWELRRSTE